jgi:DNA-binding transcriptional LysR family regulator
MDVSTTMLRVLREVAEAGSFTAAAERLGYTQSAVSRQVAALERQSGSVLVERRREGVRLTPAGATLLGHARVVLDELDAAGRALAGVEPAPVRLGVYVSAGAGLLPEVAAAIARRHPGIALTTREGTTPALVRALRAGSLDLAVVTTRPPHHPLDADAPPLPVETLAESALLVAVSATGRYAGRAALTADELAGAAWVASQSTAGEPLLGVWPGLGGRPRVVHRANDWLTKLRLVAATDAVTTLPSNLVAALPDGVAALPVTGAPPEIRRMVLAHRPGPLPPAVRAVAGVVLGISRA